MNDGNAKQQIADKVKNSSNIMVTVSSNPSVDELSAALGLTLLLNKMKKHATAVFSGSIPPAITFLDPQKTFENTVDSLRDFIIALDKEKADHLRYKVDGDVVKIFITPYRTTITSDDLDFSQGDYNVELVLALGVKNRDDLDTALSAHGRILHDATVASISAGGTVSELGSINWREENASSLSEMLVSLSESFKDKGALDEQIATAFLTGIVAATDRFSNERTSSKVMTIAAQLMSAGANQQLIASKLEEAHEIGGTKPSGPSGGSSTSEAAANSDGTTDLTEGQATKLERKEAAKKIEEPPKQKENDGSLTISHEKEGDLDEVTRQTEEEEREAAAKAAQEEIEKQAKAVPDEQQEEAAKKAEDNLAQQLQSVAPAAAAPATPSVADLQKDLAAANAEVDKAAEQPPVAPVGSAEMNQWQGSDQAPSMGGTLNATTEQAEQDKRRALEEDRNHTILTHGSGNNYVGDSTPTFQSPLNAASQPPEEQPMVDPFRGDSPTPTLNAVSPVTLPPINPPQETQEPSLPTETLADIDRENRMPHEEARAAVDAAFGAVPFTPASAPQPDQMPAPEQPVAPPAVLPPMPPMPDFSTLPPLPQANPEAGPDAAFSGALPPDKLEDVFGSSPAPAPSPAPQSNDPAQFKIPGQG